MAHYDSPEALSHLCCRLVSRGSKLTTRGYDQLPTCSRVHRGPQTVSTAAKPDSQATGGTSPRPQTMPPALGAPLEPRPLDSALQPLPHSGSPSCPATSPFVPRFSDTQATCPTS